MTLIKEVERQHSDSSVNFHQVLLSYVQRQQEGDKMEAQPQAKLPKIPHNLVFTYKNNILQTERPAHFYKNVQHTINEYRSAWDDAEAPVIFLDDPACVSNITSVFPDLVKYFKRERYGGYKADICRLAFLYLHGGYYFDVDLEVLSPFVPDANVTFVSARDIYQTYFFQAVLFTSPGNPIIRESLQKEFDYYEQRLKFKDKNAHIGPLTMQMAFDSFSSVEERGGPEVLLNEIALKDENGHMYPHITRYPQSWLCNVVVHDSMRGNVHFRSRVEGSTHCPFPKKK